MSTMNTAGGKWKEQPIFQSYQNLTAARLNQLQDNLFEQIRLALLHTVGPGVVNGLSVTQIDSNFISINAGFGIDRSGRPVIVEIENQYNIATELAGFANGVDLWAVAQYQEAHENIVELDDASAQKDLSDQRHIGVRISFQEVEDQDADSHYQRLDVPLEQLGNSNVWCAPNSAVRIGRVKKNANGSVTIVAATVDDNTLSNTELKTRLDQVDSEIFGQISALENKLINATPDDLVTREISSSNTLQTQLVAGIKNEVEKLQLRIFDASTSNAAERALIAGITEDENMQTLVGNIVLRLNALVSDYTSDVDSLEHKLIGDVNTDGDLLVTPSGSDANLLEQINRLLETLNDRIFNSPLTSSTETDDAGTLENRIFSNPHYADNLEDKLLHQPHSLEKHVLGDTDGELIKIPTAANQAHSLLDQVEALFEKLNRRIFTTALTADGTTDDVEILENRIFSNIQEPNNLEDRIFDKEASLEKRVFGDTPTHLLTLPENNADSLLDQVDQLIRRLDERVFVQPLASDTNTAPAAKLENTIFYNDDSLQTRILGDTFDDDVFQPPSGAEDSLRVQIAALYTQLKERIFSEVDDSYNLEDKLSAIIATLESRILNVNGQATDEVSEADSLYEKLFVNADSHQHRLNTHHLRLNGLDDRFLGVAKHIIGGGRVFGWGYDSANSTASELHLHEGLAINAQGQLLYWPGGAITLADQDNIASLDKQTLVLRSAVAADSTNPVALSAASLSFYIVQVPAAGDIPVLELNVSNSGQALSFASVTQIASDGNSQVFSNPLLYRLVTLVDQRAAELQKKSSKDLRELSAAALGAGVVYGFAATERTADGRELSLTPGLALDGIGRQIKSAAPIAVNLNHLVIDPPPIADKTTRVTWFLHAHYAIRENANSVADSPFLKPHDTLLETVGFSLSTSPAAPELRYPQDTITLSDSCLSLDDYIAARQAGSADTRIDADRALDGLSADTSLEPGIAGRDICAFARESICLGQVVLEFVDDTLVFAPSASDPNLADITVKNVRQHVFRNRVLAELIDQVDGRLSLALETQTEDLRKTLLGLAGSGIISGFDIATANTAALQLSPGQLIDRQGNLLVTPARDIAIDDALLLGAIGQGAASPLAALAPGVEYVVKAHHALSCDYDAGFRESPSASDSSIDSADQRYRDSVLFSISAASDSAAPYYYDKSDLDDIHHTLAGDQNFTQETYIVARTSAGQYSAIHVDGDIDTLLSAPPPVLQALDDKQLRFVNLAAGIEIGRLIGPETADSAPVISSANQRQYVYRNPLLFELLSQSQQRLSRVFAHQQAHLDQALISVAGTGVVYGFDIDAAQSTNKAIFIKEGSAIDPWGRQLFWPGGLASPKISGLSQAPDQDYRLSIHFALSENYLGTQILAADAASKWVDNDLVFVLTPVTAASDPQSPSPTNATCISQDDYIEDRLLFPADPLAAATAAEDLSLISRATPTAQSAYSSHTIAGLHYRYDPAYAVYLGCVKIDGSKGDDWALSDAAQLSAEGRPTVYRNPLLFELHQQLNQRLARVTRQQSEQMRKNMLALAGPGVVYGFNYQVDGSDRARLTIEPGMFIDPRGRQVFLSEALSLDFEDLGLASTAGVARYTLKAYYQARCQFHTGVIADGSDEPHWFNEGVVFRLEPSVQGLAEEEAPDDEALEGELLSEDAQQDTGDALEPMPSIGQSAVDDESPFNLNRPKSQEEYLCERLEFVVNGDYSAYSEFSEIETADSIEFSGSTEFTASQGIDLGQIDIEFIDTANSSGRQFGTVTDEDLCEGRQIVYRNPLLFELLKQTENRLDRIYEKQTERLNLALLGLAGPGVLYGMAIDDTSATDNRLRIHSGVAIDPFGRPMYWNQADVNVFERIFKPADVASGDHILQVHYGLRQSLNGVEALDNIGDNRWYSEELVFTLTPLDQWQADERFPPGDPADPCMDWESYILSRQGQLQNGPFAADAKAEFLQGQRQSDIQFFDAAGVNIKFDVQAGLVLGKVKVENTGADLHIISAPEVENYRELVHRNPLLHELLKQSEHYYRAAFANLKARADENTAQLQANQDQQWLRLRRTALSTAGSGVVFGGNIKELSRDVITVSPGIVMDEYGHVLSWQEIRLNVAELDFSEARDGESSPVNNPQGHYQLQVHYRASITHIDSVDSDQACIDGPAIAGKIVDGVAFSLRPVDVAHPAVDDALLTQQRYLFKTTGVNTWQVLKDIDTDFLDADFRIPLNQLASRDITDIVAEKGLGLATLFIQTENGTRTADTAQPVSHENRRQLLRNTQLFELHQQTQRRMDNLYEAQSRQLRQGMLSIAGYGVLHGFDITVKGSNDELAISSGAIIDKYGRQLLWDGEDVDVDTLIYIDDQQATQPAPLDLPNQAYMLRAHYAVVCDWQQGYAKNTAIGEPPINHEPVLLRETVVFSLTPFSEGQAAPAPAQADYRFDTTKSYICKRGRKNFDGSHVPPWIAVDGNLEGFLQESSQWLQRPVTAQDDGPAELVFSLDGAIDLGVIAGYASTSSNADIKSRLRIRSGASNAPIECRHRQYVKRNPLLAELIERNDTRLDRLFDLQSEHMRQALLGLAGSGVVYGYDLSVDSTRQLRIEPGMLIDNQGRQLVWEGHDQPLTAQDEDDDYQNQALPAGVYFGTDLQAAGRYRVFAHYAIEWDFSQGIGRNPTIDFSDKRLLTEKIVFSVQAASAPALPQFDPFSGQADNADLSQEHYQWQRSAAIKGAVPVDEDLQLLLANVDPIALGEDKIAFYREQGFPLADIVIGEQAGADAIAIELVGVRKQIPRNSMLLELIKQTEARMSAAMDYQLERLYQSLAGVAGKGVVYGFDIDSDKSTATEVFVNDGLAIDGKGRPLIWKGKTLALPAALQQSEQSLTLSIHYEEAQRFGGYFAKTQASEFSQNDSAWFVEALVIELSPGSEEPAPKRIPTDPSAYASEADYLFASLSQSKPDSGEEGVIISRLQLSLVAGKVQVRPTAPLDNQEIVFRNPLLYQLHSQNQQRLDQLFQWQSQRLRQTLLGIAGTGVVYGFGIDSAASTASSLQVKSGLAIDCFGRPLFWPGGAITLDQLPQKPASSGKFSLRVHFAQFLDNRGASFQILAENPAGWLSEAVTFSLHGECAPRDHNSGYRSFDAETHAQRDYVCGRLGSADIDDVEVDPALAKMTEQPRATEALPTFTFEGKAWRYDDESGVELACVEVLENGSSIIFAENGQEICHNRDFIYRNPLLHELLEKHENHYGHHHNAVSIAGVSTAGSSNKDLAQLMDEYYLNDVGLSWSSFRSYITEGFEISFSDYVLARSLHVQSEPASLSHTGGEDLLPRRSISSMYANLVVYKSALSHSSSSYSNNVRDVKRLAIEAIEPVAGHTQTIDGKLYVNKVKVSFEIGDLSGNTFDSYIGAFHDYGGSFEFIIRTASLRDQHGHMLDGRALDMDKSDPHHAAPGVDVLVAFPVKAE